MQSKAVKYCVCVCVGGGAQNSISPRATKGLEPALHTHTHARTRARTHARTSAHTHSEILGHTLTPEIQYALTSLDSHRYETHKLLEVVLMRPTNNPTLLTALECDSHMHT